MTLYAACGQAQALEGREAGMESARQALLGLGKNQPSIGFVFASHDYAIQQVLSGVTAQAGSLPLLGFKTPAELSGSGVSRRSVVTALLGGADLHARAEWFPGFAEGGAVSGPRQAAEKMLRAFEPEFPAKNLLLVADGLGADATPLVDTVNNFLNQGAAGSPSPVVVGCLSGSDARHGRAFQIGGQQAGSGGLAAAVLSGNLKVTVGASHGWSVVGPYYEATRVRGLWVRELDGKTPGDLYAETFGVSPREWVFPPLNEMVRLYPLGIERQQQAGSEAAGYIIRSPVRLENDGGLRMNTNIPEGAIVHLMTGSADRCVEAAKEAARTALHTLQADPRANRPVLALLFVDAAWHALFQARPGEDVAAVRSVLGDSVAIAGGYTLGQIAACPPTTGLELLNQHLLVILFAEELG